MACYQNQTDSVPSHGKGRGRGKGKGKRQDEHQMEDSKRTRNKDYRIPGLIPVAMKNDFAIEFAKQHSEIAGR